MRVIDVFNGDADGICALHQLRLCQPCPEAELVTGVKRDIALLARVRQVAPGDRLTVLDVSLDKNRQDLLRLLAAGAEVRYFDHHFAGEIPRHRGLSARIDTAPDVCTSLLVSAHVGHRYRIWAVVAAFGDNLFDAARAAAEPLGLSDEALARLEELGTLLNYNGYGVTLEDLHFHPAALYRAIAPFTDPFAFIEASPVYRTLAEGYAADMALAGAQPFLHASDTSAVVMLPDAAWARRVSGVYGNLLARRHPARAHALVSVLADGRYRISVRAPLNNKTGADTLCMRFPTGGGRKAAAGINALPAEQLDAFIDAFRAQYG